MFKKIALVAAAALIATGASAATYKNGTYTGVGTGNASEITVQVTVAGGKISAVKVLKHGETPMILEAAEKGISKKVIKKNGVEGVDVVSGASNSSKGILTAVKAALAKAK